MSQAIRLLDGKRALGNDVYLAERPSAHRYGRASRKRRVADHDKAGRARLSALQATRYDRLVIWRRVDGRVREPDDFHG